MKPLALALALVACLTATAQAEWRPNGQGLFWKVNSLNQHDGFLYAIQNGCYVRHSAIQQAAPQVKYSANWKSDLVRAVNQQKDNELFLQALRESGLQPQGQQSQQHGYSATSGVSTYSTGFPYADQGGTIYGVQSYAPNIGKVDIEGLLRTQARIVERIGEQGAQANYALSDRIGQVSGAQSEIAKIQAAAELIRAASPQRTETHSWRTDSQATGATSETPSATPSTPGANSVAPSALQIVAASDYLERSCAKCHGPEKAEGNLDLTRFTEWDDASVAKFGPKILARVMSHDPDEMMPPPGKGERATLADLRVLMAVLPE